MYKILSERMGVVEGAFVRKVLVDEESDLANLPADTAPGSVAHTAGASHVWEMGLDKSWHKVSTGGGGGGSVIELDYIIGSDNGLPYVEYT